MNTMYIPSKITISDESMTKINILENKGLHYRVSYVICYKGDEDDSQSNKSHTQPFKSKN